MSEYIPVGYLKKPPDGKHAYDYLVNLQTREEFYLTNSPFLEVDFHFHHLASRLINYLVRHAPDGKQVQILDLGGGPASRSSKDIKGLYQDRVNVISTDLTTSFSTQGEHPIVASLLSLPIRHSTIDFAYSYRTSELIAEYSMESFDVVLKETARILKPGAIAFLDGPQYAKPINRSEQSPHISKLEEELRVKFFAKQMGLNLSLAERLNELFDHDYKNLVFLIIVKNPVNPQLTRLLKRAYRYGG